MHVVQIAIEPLTPLNVNAPSPSWIWPFQVVNGGYRITYCKCLIVPCKCAKAKT